MVEQTVTKQKLKKNISAEGKNMFFASESVGEGHPDKLCDQISDAIVDACFKINPNAKVAMECATKTGLIVLLGETGVTKEQVNFEQVARDVCKQVGFDHESKGLNGLTCDVITNIEAQSAEIAEAVHGAETKDESELGAGDQGLMFGYATDEWDQELLHPASHVFANKICEEMAIARKNGSIAWLRPDCKSQVIVEYRQESDGQVTPLRCYNILISTQHDPDVTNETIREELIEKIIKKVIPEEMLKDTEYVINPSGKFCIGGPHGDAGLTGRKIIVDTYGGWAPHGGGAFSGKDPSKVDRSGAYYARYVAKSLVAAGLAHRVLLQVSYAIGLADPLSIHVETYGTTKDGLTQDDLHRIVENNFSFRPGNIIKELDLKRPIYQKTASFGHFGRIDPDFKWEYPKKNLKLD